MIAQGHGKVAREGASSQPLRASDSLVSLDSESPVACCWTRKSSGSHLVLLAPSTMLGRGAVA